MSCPIYEDGTMVCPECGAPMTTEDCDDDLASYTSGKCSDDCGYECCGGCV